MARYERKLGFIGEGHIAYIILDNPLKAEIVSAHRRTASDPKKNKMMQLTALI